MNRVQLSLAAILVLGCAAARSTDRPLATFDHGRVSLVEGEGRAHHPAELDPATLEAALAGLEYRSREFAERGSDDLFGPPLLSEIAGALAAALASAGPGDRVLLEAEWRVRDDPDLPFANHLVAEFHVLDGELHVTERRFYQSSGATGAEHELRITPSPGSMARPGDQRTTVVPLSR